MQLNKRYSILRSRWLWALVVAVSGARVSADESKPGDDGMADEGPASIEQLKELDLEGLMSLEVTSVSKKKQRVSESAAAVSVITQEDIRRSGMNTIPELLRLSPGLQVAQLNGNQWAIGARGFNAVYQNKLLVVMDGRSLYDPTFAGVYWDSVDYVLGDLDRIEVIRGPGATIWGANAVNGVINITTKTARETQGWLLDGFGSNVSQDGSVRYGGKLDDQTFYRVYAKYRTADDFAALGGGDGHDGWDALRGGFRIDRFAGPQDTLTLQGDFFTARLGETVVRPDLVAQRLVGTPHTTDAAGGYLLGRWSHVIAPDSDLSTQVYYNRYQRHQASVDSDLDMWDVDFQHRFPLAAGHAVIWGAGLRYEASHFEGNDPGFVNDPVHREDYVVNAFVQDDVTLIPDRLHLILGSKFEQNSHTGFEVEPSARAVWTPDARQAVWGAVSRAVRTPSVYEEDTRLAVGAFPTGPSGPPGEVTLAGSRQLDSENLLSFELGYRVQPHKDFSIDVAGFYNIYSDLIATRQGTTSFDASPIPHVVVPLSWANNMSAHTWGVEVAATWAVTDQWRLTASYSRINIEASGGTASDQLLAENSTPRDQFQLRSYYNLTKDIDLNAGVFYTEAFGSAQKVPSLVRVDAGVSWRPRPGLEVSAGVTNLLDDRHPEFSNEAAGTGVSEVPRTVFVQMTWRF